MQPTFKIIPKFLSSEESSSYFEKCRDGLPFTEMKWGRGRLLPRLCCRLTPDEFKALGDDAVAAIENVTEEVSKQTGTAHVCQGVWCNYYRDGSDWCPEHKDTYETTVAVLSLGGKRYLNVRDDATRVLTKYTINGGDLYWFNEEFNATHTHAVPKSTALNEPRISLVFFLESVSGIMIDLRDREIAEIDEGEALDLLLQMLRSS